MTYTVKEIFYTLQGEGANAGRPAVFCRFSGCNLWTGREADRAHAVCTFCDTDFVGVGPDGGKFSRAVDLADAVSARWPWDSSAGARPLVVCTGGRFESLDFEHFFLQPMDGPLVEENTRRAVAYCLAHPRWRLSVQTHKVLGIR
jgi:organic radical activating enzyme